MISVYWDKLCCYAPFDLGDRKPKAITNIETLEKQCELLKNLNIGALKAEFERVASILPNYDDDPIIIVIFPSDHENVNVNEKQNGVVGTSLFGNMLIQVNPLIAGYEAWIKYVFAHEYHHTVWGNYWFMLHGGELLLTVGFVHNQSEVFVRKLPVLMPVLHKYRHLFYKNSPSSTSCTA